MSAHPVIYERTATGFSAYVPDLPRCSTTGATLDETKRHRREAINGHLAVMQEFSDPIPQPTTIAEPLQIPA